MPSLTGVSVVGPQFLGLIPTSSNRFLNIFLLNRVQSDRFTRVGTVLVCFRLPDGSLPTAYVAKLYGNGIAEVLTSELPIIGLEIWVRWFEAGIQWQSIAPDG